ncbi:hypothetical protein [Streptomyces sp. MK37H]|uniref:hypothetical protein n=1 Tax=Streptomyces sp. MK37H TaxID=2699117 RepID=UPI001B381666|nr:hypothetical protein [Streptomyces sp. MK37H]MBP8533699.1 hypothetical protein [Streptomyces sp. MK37H]
MMQQPTRPTLEKYDRLFQHYALLSNLQVQGETIYAGRTNVITLTQGLLLIGLQAFSSGASQTSSWIAVLISLVGVILSVAWLAFEQRNQIYFNGRGQFLAKSELEVLSAAEALDIPIHGIWTTVGSWVSANAKWYQRYSAPRIQRGLVPILFIFLWLFILTLQSVQLATYHEQKPREVICREEDRKVSCEIPDGVIRDAKGRA